MKFKVGDKVRRKDSSRQDTAWELICTERGVTTDAMFTVIGHTGACIKLPGMEGVPWTDYSFDLVATDEDGQATRLSETNVNQLAQLFYEKSGIWLETMADKPKIIAGLNAVFSKVEQLTGLELLDKARFIAKRTVWDMTDPYCVEDRLGDRKPVYFKTEDLAQEYADFLNYKEESQ